MAHVIKKTADANGVFRYVDSIHTPNYPTADWAHNPDLEPVDGVPQHYWKWDGAGVVEMSQAEKDAVDAALAEVAAIPNNEGQFSFLHWGAAKNTWLRYNFSMPSNAMPALFMNDAVVTGLGWVCYTNNADATVELYKNGVLHFSWTLVNKRYAYKTDGLAGVKFDAGDQLSVKLTQGTTRPHYPSLNVFYRYTGSGTGEGGGSSI